MAYSPARLLLGAILVLTLAARQTRGLYFYLQVSERVASSKRANGAFDSVQ